MGRGLFSGLWDVEAAIYIGPPPSADLSDCLNQRTEAALRAARWEAERNGWALSIAIVNAAGEPLGLVKLDGSPCDSARRAIAKAQRAAAAGHDVQLPEEASFMGRSASIQCLQGAISIYVDNRCIIALGVEAEDRDSATHIANTAADAFLGA